MSGLKRAALIFVLCIAASVLCAYVVLGAGNFWDGNSQEPFSNMAPESLLVGGMFGVISFPFVYLATRKRRLPRVAPIILAIVVSEIIVVKPFAGTWDTFISAVGTLALALFLCAAGWLDRA